VEATVVFGVLGIVFGLIAGNSKRTADRWISSIVDILMSLPSLVVIFAVLALFDQSLTAAMFTLGLFSAGGLVRVVRAATRSAREELYVAAARVSGLGTVRILFRHIMPRLVGPIVIQLSLFLGIALIVQSGLGFLNLGVVAPNPSWGGMVGEASQVLQQFPWLLLPSGGIIGLTVLACGLIGDAVRDLNAETQSRSGGFVPRRYRRSRTMPGESKATELLSVENLSIAFLSRQSQKTVVNDISFSVMPGELVGLVGESGSGKTVTALSVLGLLPANALVTADGMAFAGKELASASQAAFRTIRGKGIGLISQEPMVSLDPSFRVGQQLGEVIRHQWGLKGTALTRRVSELLTDVRLPDPADVSRRYPHQLSGGMAQRVAIALALAGDPRLLIADEPTTALDVTVQAEILDLLRKLRDERGMAIVLVTHDLGVVADFCERVIVMQHGEIVERQEVVSLFSNPQHEYTKRLIAATPNLLSTDATVYARLISTEESAAK
jgi:peptide/nickel transport system permease protein